MTTTPPAPQLDIRRGAERSRTELPWLDSNHSFSYGLRDDPSNVHHGVLLVNNDDTVRAGSGFGTHPHQDMEIVTWVLTGSLVHQDSEGHCGVIYPGLAQRMSAGTGILHSEKNDSWRLSGGLAHSEPVRFVQMWVPPDEPGITPGYEQIEVDNQLLSGGLVPVASGMASMTAGVPYGSRTDTPHCTWHAWRSVTASNCRTRPSFTSSWLKER